MNNDIMSLNIFMNNKDYIRDKENLSYTLFKDMDLICNNNGISFFRCDFRGSKFINCNFYQNNLDRSDFVSCVFQNVTFNNTQIAACEIKNCYFNEVIFEEQNYYNNTSIQECTFVNCKFMSEKFLVNMKNCKFIECIFSNCGFERSTTEKLYFEECSICHTDLATMHAERHIFKNCDIKNVYIGIDYIFGYLFYNTNIEEMKVLYHGEEVHIANSNAFAQYIKDLWTQQRYYEFINANIIYGYYDCIPETLQKSLELSKNKTDSIRELDISDILDSLCFYIENSILPYNCFVKAMNIIDNYNWSDFSSKEYITYMTICNKIALIVNKANFSENFINSAQDSISTVTFHCKTDDYDKAYNLTTTILSEICTACNLSENFILLDKEKGSWILTFAICSSVVLVLPKIIKCYADTILEFRTKSKISKQLEQKLENKHLKISDIKLISEIAEQANIITNNDMNYEKISIPNLIDSISVGL